MDCACIKYLVWYQFYWALHTNLLSCKTDQREKEGDLISFFYFRGNWAMQGTGIIQLFCPMKTLACQLSILRASTQLCWMIGFINWNNWYNVYILWGVWELDSDLTRVNATVTMLCKKLPHPNFRFSKVVLIGGHHCWGLRNTNLHSNTLLSSIVLQIQSSQKFIAWFSIAPLWYVPLVLKSSWWPEEVSQKRESICSDL